jgi:voltage-gated potassium channel
MSNGQIRDAAIKLTHSSRFRKIVFALILAVIFLGLAIPFFERGAEGARIDNEWKGIYFAGMTVTGSGYGDMVPVTTAGRVIAIMLEVFGVVLFGSVMAFVSVELLRYQEDFNMRRILERIDEQSKQIEELKKEIGFLVKK